MITLYGFLHHIEIIKPVSLFMNSPVMNLPPVASDLDEFLAMPVALPRPPSLAPIAANIEQHELLVRVQEYLRYYGGEQAIKDVSMLDGFFAALDCAPLPVPPAQWVCAIWGGKDYLPQWPSEYAGMIFAELILHFQYNVVQHLRSAAVFKPLFIAHQVGEQGFDVIDYWCEGFMLGANLGKRSVLSLPEAATLLAPIARFAQGDGLYQALIMDEAAYVAAKQHIGQQVRLIWETSRHLPDYGVDNVPIDSIVAPVLTDTQSKVHKLGRNDLCPCGSGRKYKKCCMGKRTQ